MAALQTVWVLPSPRPKVAPLITIHSIRLYVSHGTTKAALFQCVVRCPFIALLMDGSFSAGGIAFLITVSCFLISLAMPERSSSKVFFLRKYEKKYHPLANHRIKYKTNHGFTFHVTDVLPNFRVFFFSE